METKIVLIANLKRHKGCLAGIFLLLFLMSVSLCSVLALWRNSERYVHGEMERMGFGSITSWVSGLAEAGGLAEEIAALPEVDRVGVQSIIYSEYRLLEQESDSEGQLVLYEPEKYPYRIFTENLRGYENAPVSIKPGEIYISPSLSSMFGAGPGDEITFPIARNGVHRTFTIKGFFEDPFMGSSMIGMKSFLIGTQDFQELTATVSNAGIDGLARTGYMLHITGRPGSHGSAAELNRLVNENTGLPGYTEFTHSSAAIAGFMMTLQNVFTGLFLGFVAILLLVSLVVLGHSIGSVIEQDTVNMGILKTAGFTGRKLRRIQLLQYMTGIVGGMAPGLAVSAGTAAAVCQMTVTTTGLLIPSGLPLGLCSMALAAILLVLAGYIWAKTRRIEGIAPMQAITEAPQTAGENEIAFQEIAFQEIAFPGIAFPGKRLPQKRLPIKQKGLDFWLVLRQIRSGKRRYTNACVAAALLVFFASVIGRMNSWLGPDGKGLMDAFNPADLHIAVQPVGETTIADVERTILQYTGITDEYMLGMPGVTVNGINYTANVITQAERFHMLEGQTCFGENTIVLTEFAAADLGVTVGDTVTVATGAGSNAVTVSGIYQCANDMGANVGLSREGYAVIGEETAHMWCVHFFLEDVSLQPVIMQALEEAYGGDVYLHENSWPGLYGILSAMKLLMLFMYGMTVIFILIVTILTGSRILAAEKSDLGIYQAIGFPRSRLCRMFALRFGIVAFIGSVLGVVLSSLLTDPLVAVLLRMFGISNFASSPGAFTVLFPLAAVTFLFTAFAWKGNEVLLRRWSTPPK